MERMLAVTIDHFSWVPASQERIVKDGGVVMLMDMVRRGSKDTKIPDKKVMSPQAQGYKCSSPCYFILLYPLSGLIDCQMCSDGHRKSGKDGAIPGALSGCRCH